MEQVQGQIFNFGSLKIFLGLPLPIPSFWSHSWRLLSHRVSRIATSRKVLCVLDKATTISSGF